MLLWQITDINKNKLNPNILNINNNNKINKNDKNTLLKI